MYNANTDKFGRAWLEVWVPEPEPQHLVTSPPILSIDIDNIGQSSAESSPFQIGDHLLLPAIGGRYERDGEAVVFHQIFVPPERDSPIDVIYAIEDSAGVPLARSDLQLRTSRKDHHDVISNAVAFDLTGIETGTYRISVDLAADDGAPLSVPLRIIEPADEQAPFLYVPDQLPAGHPTMRLDRARQYHAMGMLAEALELVDALLRQDQESEDANELKNQLVAEQQRQEESSLE